MDEENVVYICKGLLFNLDQEGNPGVCNKGVKPGRWNARLNQPVSGRQKYCSTLLIWSIKNSQTPKAESRVMVARGRGQEGKMGLSLLLVQSSSSAKWVSSRDVLLGIMPVVDDTRGAPFHLVGSETSQLSVLTTAKVEINVAMNLDLRSNKQFLFYSMHFLPPR